MCIFTYIYLFIFKYTNIQIYSNRYKYIFIHILIKSLHRLSIYLSVYVCVTKMSRAWHASISQSWMKELIPIFWQMTDMVIDYTLEPFLVLDLHPRSQKHPPKSRRGSWFSQNILLLFSMFLGVSGDFPTFFFFFSLGTNF